MASKIRALVARGYPEISRHTLRFYNYTVIQRQNWRRALALVNLNTPKDDVIRIARHTSQAKWDINCIQFNPHACKADTFVTASNQRLEVLQLANGNTEHRCNLKSHTRTVSDIDWSPFDVNQLASCSVDTYTYLWDIRDSKKPAASFQSVAGAYQVKWNKVVNNMFATTHEGDIRIWDPRKGNTPIQYVAAHLSKIHGLDWNPTNQYKLVTASQDCFVRFWDITNVRRTEYTLNTGSPVWRARLTPFGNGLITVVVPQLRRGENKLYLWNTSNLTQPIHTFVGHKDVVLEFHWRKQPEGVRDQQLVTWSRDQSLRIWRIDPALQELCGHDINSLPDLPDNLHDVSLTDSGRAHDVLPIIEESQTSSTTVVSLSESPVMVSNQPQTLQQEFSLVNKNIPNVTIDEMDAINRVCRVTAQIGKRTVSLNLNFPRNYPNNASPSFQFLHTTLDSNMQKQLIKVLTDTSQKHVKRNMNCLEPCLRQLIAELDSLTKTERKTPDLDIPFPLTQQQGMMQATPIYPMYSFGSFQDSSVPFPRTSGACFCSVGLLVMFGRPADIKKKVADGVEPTPKALSELAAFAKRSQNPTAFNALFPRSPPTPSNEGVSISDFYTYRERRNRTRSRSRVREVSESRHRDQDKPAKKPTKVGPVKVYDVSALLTVHKQLAETYKLDLNDVPGMCAHNAAAAAAVGRKDLVQIWNYVSVMLPASRNPDPTPTADPPFVMCAFGRPFLKTMLDHYSGYYDVQTLAMLCCVFWKKEDMQRNVTRTPSKSSMDYTPANYNPYHTVSSVTNLLKGFKAKSHHAPPRAPTGHPGPQLLSAHGVGPLSEVASHPNLSALFKQAVMKNKRSNSWSESCDDYRILDDQDPVEKAAQREQEQHENNCRMLDPNLWYQYDLHKKAYANILYCWGLHNQAAHILKFLSSPPPPHKGIEFSVKCTRCLREVRGPQCTSCKHFVLECVICHLGVRGAANFCTGCSHGGHTEHMANWFRTEQECPTGCGCECLKVTPVLATG